MLALDHVMFSVASHRDAIAELTQLGFLHREVRQLPPMGGGTAGGVGGSAVVMMQSAIPGAANYMELAYLDTPFAAPFMKPILLEKPRAAMLVHATDDARTLHARWSHDRIEVLPLIEIALPPSSVSAGQNLKLLLPTGSPPIWCNACEYESTEEFQVRHLTRHPNTAQRWTGVVVAVPNDWLVRTLDHFVRLYRRQPEVTPLGQRFRVHGGVVDVVTATRASSYPAPLILPEDLTAPRIVGVHIKAADILALTNTLFAAGTQPFVRHGYAATPILQQLGTQLLFSEADHDATPH
jgi:hypothetical protein